MNTQKTILVAEDDPVLREAYGRAFAASGYKIRMAEDGEMAIQMIEEEAPDLLICDIMMPKKDGWAVLDSFPKGKRSFPIIMVTNLEDDKSRKKCKDLADGYFVKKDMTLHFLRTMAKTLLD